MANARTQHPNAVLTPRHRRRMVGCVLEAGWTIEMTAERFQVDAKTVRKWRDRFIAEGEAAVIRPLGTQGFVVIARVPKDSWDSLAKD